MNKCTDRCVNERGILCDGGFVTVYDYLVNLSFHCTRYTDTEGARLVKWDGYVARVYYSLENYLEEKGVEHKFYPLTEMVGYGRLGNLHLYGVRDKFLEEVVKVGLVHEAQRAGAEITFAERSQTGFIKVVRMKWMPQRVKVEALL